MLITPGIDCVADAIQKSYQIPCVHPWKVYAHARTGLAYVFFVVCAHLLWPEGARRRGQRNLGRNQWPNLYVTWQSAPYYGQEDRRRGAPFAREMEADHSGGGGR